jgi:hypothetical protein
MVVSTPDGSGPVASQILPLQTFYMHRWSSVAWGTWHSPATALGLVVVTMQTVHGLCHVSHTRGMEATMWRSLASWRCINTWAYYSFVTGIALDPNPLEEHCKAYTLAPLRSLSLSSRSVNKPSISVMRFIPTCWSQPLPTRQYFVTFTNAFDKHLVATRHLAPTHRPRHAKAEQHFRAPQLYGLHLCWEALHMAALPQSM